MKKVNPLEGLAVLAGLIAFILFWLKVDPNGYAMLSFFCLQGCYLVYKTSAHKHVEKKWWWTLIGLALLLIFLAIAGFISGEVHWLSFLLAITMYHFCEKRFVLNETTK